MCEFSLLCVIPPTVLFLSVLHTASNPFCCYNILYFSQMQILSWMHEDCSVDWWCEQAKNAEGGGCIKPNSGNLCGEPSSFDTQEIIMPTSLSCCFFVRVHVMAACLYSTPPLSYIFTQDLDFVIDELSFVCQVIQRYFEFVEARDCLSMSSEASQGLFQSFHSSIGSYVRLEDSYCLLSVKEAVRIAEPIEVSVAVVPQSLYFLFFLSACLVRTKYLK